MVRDMDNNEKGSSEEKKQSSSERKLHLDLSEALNTNAEDDDDIIELKDEVIVEPEKKEEEIKLSDDFARQTLRDEPLEEKVIDIKALSEETGEQQNVIHLAEDLAFEEDDEKVEEIQPLAHEKPLKPDDADEVIEITEFDDIISEDDNEMATLADPGEGFEPEEEEEFLELIDVEEDSLPEKQAEKEHKEIESEVIQFDGPKADVEDVELEDFINESLDEELRINDDLEDNLTNSLGIEVGSEINLSDQTSEEEDFDFNMDSSEISKKIDQLDTIFFDETESEDEFIEETESEDEFIEETEPEDEFIEVTEPEDEFIEVTEPENKFTEETELDDEVIAEPPSDPVFVEEAETDTDSATGNENNWLTDDDTSEEATPEVGIANLAEDQIEASIQRIIQQNFSEKIESMIVAVIEKAVLKEIDRLKSSLLEDKSDYGS
jgi:hypothetical protein